MRFKQDPAAYLPLVFTRWEGVEGMNYSPLIYAFGQKNVAVTGGGVLDGQADEAHWWPWKGRKEYGWQEGMPHQDEGRRRLFEMAEAGVPPAQRIMGEGAYLRPNFIQSSSDFLSLDTTGARGPRQPDGRLPQLDFLRPVAGSRLIDAGIDGGLPYVGAVPDLGAYEFGLSTTVTAHPLVALRVWPPYPNPFRQAVQIRFELPRPAVVSLSVGDLMGRRVVLLLEKRQQAGVHEVRWEPPVGLAAGQYLLVLEADGYRVQHPLVYVR